MRIFTSGTTGLPKAAEVSHRKIITWDALVPPGWRGSDKTDRHYNCLPMHHSVGGVVAMGAPLVNGGACVIAPKFSASRFWDDVARHQCTSFQYIGELCRYLVGAPTHIRERGAKLRLALGNGLAAPVWTAFAVAVPADSRVLEFYASTEGNVWLYNVEGRIGALGRLPAYLAAKAAAGAGGFRRGYAGARCAAPTGFAGCAADDEPGEALGRIAGDAASRFEGYADARGDGEARFFATCSRPATRGCARAISCERDARGVLPVRRPGRRTRSAGRARTSPARRWRRRSSAAPA